MPGVQEWIYKLEEGGGARVIKIFTAVLLFAGLAVFHDLRKYKNFHSPEAMDQAQLARNMAEGNGFTTQFVRPLSIHLVQARDPNYDPRLGGNHPDIANAPVYPVVLAGLMKVLPMDFSLPAVSELRHRPFGVYQPEMYITVFNQMLFLLAAVLLYFLARRLFDSTVGWVSVILFVGAEIFWRFSMSGLSTMLLIVLFLGLTWLLLRIEELGRPEELGPEWRLIALAAAIGLVVGIAGLTRYSLAWLILPVAAFLGLFVVRRRWVVLIMTVLAFGVVMTPWMARNHSVSGKLFGVAGYAMTQSTLSVPGSHLERTLTPEETLRKVMIRDYVRKFVVNGREIFTDDLPRLGGSWIGAFFLVGLLIPFRNPGLSRIRLFALASLLTLAAAQAMGRTHLSAEVPEVNSENLLVVVAPLVLVFGVAFFFILLEQIDVPIPQLRPVMTVVFVAVMCAPLVLGLVQAAQSRENPVAYPPYLPPLIHESAQWMRERELIMTDIPWAVAWYGNRQSVWLTLDPNGEFFKLNDEIRAVQALYLTERTLGDPMHLAVRAWVAAQQQRRGRDVAVPQDGGWPGLALEVMVSGRPPAFPLRTAAAGFLPHQMFLTDWERWKLASQ